MTTKSLQIAIDYDGTYTEDPAFFDALIVEGQRRGHRFLMVTSRAYDPVDHEQIKHPLLPGVTLVFTSGIAKRFFLKDRCGWTPDVWIDDDPASVDQGK